MRVTFFWAQRLLLNNEVKVVLLCGANEAGTPVIHLLVQYHLFRCSVANKLILFWTHWNGIGEKRSNMSYWKLRCAWRWLVGRWGRFCWGTSAWCWRLSKLREGVVFGHRIRFFEGVLHTYVFQQGWLDPRCLKTFCTLLQFSNLTFILCFPKSNAPNVSCLFEVVVRCCCCCNTTSSLVPIK